jgi:hypothetical protein
MFYFVRFKKFKVFYKEISMKCNFFIILILYALSTFSQSIKIITPNGGENFDAGQMVELQCFIDIAYSYSDLNYQYSIDSGNTWRRVWVQNLQHPTFSAVLTYLWQVPHLKHGSTSVFIKVASRSNTADSVFDISDGMFTIQPSANDIYEPNDDFASAREIGLGESVVKEAIVMRSLSAPDSNGYDPSLADVDFYKLNLTAGKIVNIRTLIETPWQENCFEVTFSWNVLVRLYDASKNLIGTREAPFYCNISHSGIYYCEISSIDTIDYWNDYDLLIYQSDPVTIISPNGGEDFQVGQPIAIHWKTDSMYHSFNFYYSLDKGLSWKETGQIFNASDTWTWIAPALKNRTDQALFRVSAINVMPPLSDVSNGTFTIQAAPMDMYEPNNDISSAYPVALGDSIVLNASTCRYGEDTTRASTTFKPDSVFDIDFYKVILKGGTLMRIHQWVDTTYTQAVPGITLFDIHGSMDHVAQLSHYGKLCTKFYIIPQSDIYFISVRPSSFQAGNSAKYSISTHSIPILTNSTLQAENDSSWRFIDDFTKLSIDFKLSEDLNSNISIIYLAQNELDPLPDETAKVKAFAIFCKFPPSAQISADITIPYNYADLNGFSEKLLSVAYQNFNENSEWKFVSGSIDTVKHQLTFQMPYIACNTFQLYIKSEGTSDTEAKTVPSFSGIQTRYSQQQKECTIHFSLSSVTNAEFQLFDMQGKCKQKNLIQVGSGNSIYRFNLGALTSGKYMLNIKAGRYHKQEALLIIN